MLYDNRIELTVPPRSGRSQVLRLINDMLRRQPSPQRSITDLAPLLESAINTIKRRSVVLLVSDFICAPGWDRPMSVLSQRHDLLPVRVWDRRESELPDVGVVVVEDSETGEQLDVDTHDPKLRRRFAEAATRREEELGRTFRRVGVDELTMSTEEDIVSAILRFVALRKRARHQRR